MPNYKLANPKTRDIVLRKYNYKCAYCGTELTAQTLTIDHIIPIRRKMTDHYEKGADEVENYNPSCGSCNCSKSTLSLEKWRSEILKKTERLRRDNPGYRICLRMGLVKEVRIKSFKFYFETLN